MRYYCEEKLDADMQHTQPKRTPSSDLINNADSARVTPLGFEKIHSISAEKVQESRTCDRNALAINSHGMDANRWLNCAVTSDDLSSWK